MTGNFSCEDDGVDDDDDGDSGGDSVGGGGGGDMSRRRFDQGIWKCCGAFQSKKKKDKSSVWCRTPKHGFGIHGMFCCQCFSFKAPFRLIQMHFFNSLDEGGFFQ